jgi:peptide/nickel transport system substrate-binding protein
VKGQRIIAILAGVVAIAAFAYWFQSSPPRTPSTAGLGTGVVRGGRLLATFRSEPSSFNRYVSANLAEELISRMTQATLVRLNRATGELEPRLAREWAASQDGLTWTLTLRPNLKFSDGVPFSSADVLFSFKVLYDVRVQSPIGPSVMIADRPLAVTAPDDQTIVVTFPAPYGPGISVLDSVPILPAHKLSGALSAGAFRQAWNVTTPPVDVVGLGPFVLKEYAPGQRLVFGRNPNFWRVDDQGRPLPYLDEVELQIVPEQNAEVLRLEAGAVDLTTDQVRAEDLSALQTLQNKGVITLNEAGIGTNPQMFWLNLNPASELARKRPWSQRTELRLAISHAIDRRRIVDTVYLGAAEPIFGPITPGHGEWFLSDLPKADYDPARATSLLESIGLTDRTSDGNLDDERGETVRLTLATLKGHTVRERMAAIIQEQLRAVGLTLDVVPLERSALIPHVMSGKYEAAVFSIEFDSFDPGAQLDFWTSSGPFHLWNPGQPKPATEWEAQIDALMLKQSTTLDRAERRRLFADVQRVFAAHLPIIYFAAPKVVVATSARVGGTMPSVLALPVLWNAEMLWLVPPPAGTSGK